MSGRLNPVGVLVRKDLLVLRRSPLLVAILVIYPVALALLIGVALGAAPAKPRVAVYSGIATGHGSLRVGGAPVNIAAYTRDLDANVTPVPEPSPTAAIAAVRAGRVTAAIIIPSDIVDQVRNLIVNGVGSPTVQLVLNDRNPLERDLVDAQLQTRIDEVQSAVSKALLGTALSDLHTVVTGGQLSFAGANVSLLGLRGARTIVAGAIGPLTRVGLGPRLAPGLRKVVSFADIATAGLSFASPLLGQIQNPLTVQRRELSGQSTPTAFYGVAIAVTAATFFLGLLLAASLLALERSDGVYTRLVRGRLGKAQLLSAKVLTSAGAATAVGLIMSAVVSIFVGIDWSRCGLWVVALLAASLAFGGLGVALGALAREVATASLLAVLVGLPVAFLALVPGSAVSSGVSSVVAVISFVFPFKAALSAVSVAFSGTGGSFGLSLAHLLGLALGAAILARLALMRFAN